MSRAAVVIVCTALAACGGPVAQYTFQNAPPHALQPREGSRVTWLTLQPGEPFVEIGTVTFRAYLSMGLADEEPTQSTTHVDGEAMTSMRNEAGRRGCDALIYRGVVAGQHQATCIVYR